jgi:CRISPR/Cas system-associated protein Csm6
MLIAPHINSGYKETKNSLHREWDDEKLRIESIRNNPEFIRWISSYLKQSCAEIASIMKIVETEQDDVEVRLLATDTVLSRLAAEMIMEQIIAHPVRDKTVSLKFDPIKDVIGGFRVDNAEVFQTDGLQHFIRRFVCLTKLHSELILNITGGYKGLIPYLTIIGQIYEVSVKYKFEESDALITIPQLPINFDWELAVEYGDQVNGDLKKLDADKKRYLIEKNILDGNAKLTPLGRILKIYAETVDLKDEVERQLRGYCAEFRWFEYYVVPDRKPLFFENLTIPPQSKTLYF